MKKLMILVAAAFLYSCSNNTSTDASDSADRPRDVNEAITDSTKIVNDSVIVPDTNNSGADPSRTDTSGKKMD